MKPLGHIAGGYLTTRLVLRQLEHDPTDQGRLLALGTAAGFMPDLDSLYYLLRYRSLEFGEDYDHHRWLSHTFPFYWLPGAAAYWFGRLTGRRRLAQAALVITASATTHLLQDTIGSGTGLMWAWPFSRRMGGICTLHVPGGRAWLAVYNRHPIAWVERLIILTALLTAVVDWFRNWCPRQTVIK